MQHMEFPPRMGESRREVRWVVEVMREVDVPAYDMYQTFFTMQEVR